MNKKGFTLNELLVTIAVMGVLAAVTVPKVFGYIAHSKASEVSVNLLSFNKYKQDYYDLHGSAGATLEQLGMQFPEGSYFSFEFIPLGNKGNGNGGNGNSGNGNGNKAGKNENSNGSGAGTTKVTVCHVPPGNPAAAHEITIGSPAYDAHVAHGDPPGPCENTSILTVTAREDVAGDCRVGDGVVFTFIPDGGSTVANTEGSNCLRYMDVHLRAMEE